MKHVKNSIMENQLTIENSDLTASENDVKKTVLELTDKEPFQTRLMFMHGDVWLFYITGDLGGIVNLTTDYDHSAMINIKLKNVGPGYFDNFVDYHAEDIFTFFPHLLNS